eukprot:s984_g1.t1
MCGRSRLLEGAFAAIPGDGSVHSWGNAESGGDSSAVQDQLRDVQQIQASDCGFAAILGDGSVASMIISEGLADHFAGDAVIVVDGTDTVTQIAPRLASPGSATWAVQISLSDMEIPNQPSGAEGKEDLTGSLRQAMEALRDKGVSTLAVGSRGGNGDSEVLATAALGALLDVFGGTAPAERSKKEQKPIELHFVVEGPPTEILRCRDAVEKAVAKRSDAGFINAMRDAGQADGPAWLTEGLLSQLKGKKGGNSTSGWRKQLSEDGAMRGIMASQFLKLADVVKQVLEKEELTGLFEPLNSGPEATA